MEAISVQVRLKGPSVRLKGAGVQTGPPSGSNLFGSIDGPSETGPERFGPEALGIKQVLAQQLSGPTIFRCRKIWD